LTLFFFKVLLDKRELKPPTEVKMMEITIYPIYLFFVYIAIKGMLSFVICKQELQYPIWNEDGVQIPRSTFNKISMFFRHWIINPEWGTLKSISFVPVFLLTGSRFVYSFLPWKIQKTPPFCSKCKDKGKYYIRPFMKHGKGTWNFCDCENSQKISQKKIPEITYSCKVCLDTGTIGKERPCTHCYRKSVNPNYLKKLNSNICEH